MEGFLEEREECKGECRSSFSVSSKRPQGKSHGAGEWLLNYGVDERNSGFHEFDSEEGAPERKQKNESLKVRDTCLDWEGRNQFADRKKKPRQSESMSVRMFPNDYGQNFYARFS